MSIIIGSARIDENGHATGGKAGDQTGKEVSTQEFYVSSKGWYILRAKSSSHANKLAKAMKTACANNNIGYDQNERYGVIKHHTDSKVKTECDCSSLVRECIIEATGKDVGDFNTESEPKVLEKSGLFKDRISYKNGTTLYTGDVLVTKTKGHTVIVISGKSRSNGNDVRIAKPTLKSGDKDTSKGGTKDTEVSTLQKNLNQAKVRDDNGDKLDEDGKYGKLTSQAVYNFQKKYSLEKDAIYGKQTADKMDDVLN